MKNLTILFWAMFLSVAALFAQSSLHIRNSSWLDFDITVGQRGSFHAIPSNFSLYQAQSLNWEEDVEVFATVRDSTLMPLLDSVIYEIQISHGAAVIKMDLRLLRNGGLTTVASRLHGLGYDTGWSADGNFHNVQVTIAGRPLTLQYKADNDDSGQSMDFRLAIHESEIYHIDPADFANPNVLNVMAYNIQMLPLGVVGLPQAADRADLLPAQFSPSQDVVIFEEAFDLLPLYVNLIPAMEAAGFAHNSGILNNYLPFNGGVIIFSRWPIERTAEYDFLLCGPNAQDCLANKGIMYARINKLGKPYNVFGTHFDAGSDSADIAAKTLQYAEMREFIAAQGISPLEPVIWGGDLNTDAANSHNLYGTLRDSIDIVVPDYTGFVESNFSRDTGAVIDHVFADPRYLLPVEAKVFITTFTSLESVLWDLSNFSDHRAAVSRFRFPDFATSPGDQLICLGDPFSVTGSADIPVTRAWYRDNTLIPGLSGATLTYLTSSVAETGDYAVEMQYSHAEGTGAGPIDLLMNPSGPMVRTVQPRLQVGHVDVSAANCANAAAAELMREVAIFPNPTTGVLHLRRHDAQPLLWHVSDLRGRVLVQGKWLGMDMELDLSGVGAGMYLLHIQDAKGCHLQQKVMVAD
jgi:Secretion system C-terminal sorting domain/Endonuclease/Exonuclease/phosphatase family